MDFEHTLLLLLFFLPLAYKISFWKDIFSLQDISNKRKLAGGYTHFFSYIELPLFLLSFFVYYNSNLEVFFFNFFLYFFALMHIFIFGKILRRKTIFGKETWLHLIMSACVCILIFMLCDNTKNIFLYALISGVMLVLPFIFLIGSTFGKGKK